MKLAMLPSATQAFQAIQAMLGSRNDMTSCIITAVCPLAALLEGGMPAYTAVRRIAV